jgi:hypothetical protein
LQGNQRTQEDLMSEPVTAARRTSWRAIVAAVPVALVNATAFIGQFAWVRQHVPWIVPGQVLFAVALESVAVYLAWHAHLAQLANDSAGRLKAGAYIFALVIGAMNYSHYASHWRPNALAVGLGLMSALSPWLWGVHSRRASRDRLFARGLVEEHAVRLGAARWTWHPWRAMAVTSASAWTGENDPKRAIAGWEERHAARRARSWRAKGAPALAQAVRQDAIGTGAPAVQAHDEPMAQIFGRMPAGPSTPPPGTLLNGHPVLAIADLAAQPVMGASHEIPGDRIADVEAHLLGLRPGSLPSEREVSRMLCPEHPEHNHRRKAAALIAARKALHDVAADPRLPRLNGSTVIATPVGTMPGGAPANG